MKRRSLVALCLTSLCFASVGAGADKKTDKKANAGSKGKSKMVFVMLETSEGNIKLELDSEKAPKTVANFKEYVESGHYDGTIFHRVIDSFMIQGGGMDANMKEKSTKKPIENEGTNGLKNDKYTLAMARTGDPNSATAQFFINLVNNDYLNTVPGRPGYAVFGKVVDGTAVVDKIAKVKTGNSGFHQNVPTAAITIKSAKIVK
jgi:peptidyl-prolyl cis-trans isomerase B (cyclophilin B)